MITVVLTGASGFVGKSIFSTLIFRGFHVLALSRNQIYSPSEFSKEFSSEVVLVHCAWAGVLGSERNSQIQIQNHQLSTKIYELALHLNAKAIIAFGSQAEYGNPNIRVFENQILQPTTLYGKAKVDSYYYLREKCESAGIALVWLRLFDSYGPGDHPAWFLPYVINSALHDVSPELTICNQMWDYLYIDDVSSCILSILFSMMETSVASSVYNLSSDAPVCLKELVEEIFAVINPPRARPIFGKVPYRKDQVLHLQGANQKLFDHYQWRPRHKLSEGIRHTIDYFRNGLELLDRD